MRDILKSSVAAAVLTAAAFSLSPTAANAGVVGLSNEKAVALTSATEQVHWRPYCHRHWRHYGYYGYSGGCGARYYGSSCGTCSTCGVYGASSPAYYGYASPGYYGSGWGGGGLLGLGFLGL